MCDYLENLDFEKFIKIATFITTIVLAVKALLEYSKSQKWKRNEFLAKEMKDFFSDRDVKKALLILDWNRIDIPLYENEIPSNKERSIFFVDETHLENSLSVSPNSEFNDEETIIRKSIDEFLVRLSTLQNYIDNNLFTTKDLKPYIIYWMGLIGDKNRANKNPIYIEKLWLFIKRYEYSQVIKMLKNYGYEI
ncbi:Uncharacterised protein [Chryseobacterium gleum]|uniref:Uncharacterized protein n=2 Tax=Chryseobacterium gleum TaxID=250 RepID=A0A448B3V6_CHRGE|nr:hypothetical protein [Chryseobacterium gleum]EFK36258.1 hypothetical protein HMPREF0204_11705 [Chryseobacterium gleum ATCC 35910]QQY33509.1 hypothetical protein I6I60_06965 [Chryseobacterium gleum]VEE08598.1 Uncharacterised protein [Chryseobacterium gleum]